MGKVFHRYKSTIHGDYRRNYLRCGALTGVMLVLYIVVRYMLGMPAESPEAYLTDAIMLLAIGLFSFLYRGTLPEKKVTLKELMLFGIGTAVVASVMYGLFIWLYGYVAPGQIVLFTQTLSGKEIAVDDPQLHYWAALWGIVSAVELIILGCFGAFLVALLFRTEKGEVRKKQ